MAFKAPSARDIPICTSLRQVDEINRLLGRGLQDKLFTAAQCVASVQGRILHRAAYGQLQPLPKAPATTHAVLFDLGDLTMPLATALAAQVLVSQHRLDLQQSVAQLLSALRVPPYESINLAMLLDHSSGLPANLPLAAALQAAQRRRGAAASTLGTRQAAAALRQALVQGVPPELLAPQWSQPPGSSTQVSTLGFLVLGWALEAVLGMGLEAYVRQAIYAPLGLQDDLLYVANEAPPAPLAAPRLFAPTGHCPLRQKLCCGSVWDANCWAQGGVAGHAGLFGTASAVWVLAQSLLDSALAAPASFFHTATLKRFWTRSQRFSTTRTLGWDTPSMLASNAGKRLARTAVGHVAAQGASLWIDPSTQTIGVLLFHSLPAAAQSAAQHAQALQKMRSRVFELIASEAANGPPALELQETWGALLRPF